MVSFLNIILYNLGNTILCLFKITITGGRMKKIFLIMLLIATITLSTFANSYLGSLSHFYSSSNRIGLWSNGTTYSTVARYSSDDFDKAYMNSCFVGWNNVLDLDVTPTSYSNAKIKAHIWTWSQIKDVHDEFIPGAVGLTDTTDSYYKGFFDSPKGQISGYEYRSADVYLVNDLSITLMGKVMYHEIGHSLGYSGHSSYTSDNMFWDTRAAASPSQNDINHINQLY